MTEFQATLLLTGMTRIEQQAKTREQNAQYLTSMLREIPGIAPARMYDGCTRNAYHLYMLRYKPEQFADLPRAKFLAALSAEGIPCSSGYSPLNKEAFIKGTLSTRGYERIYSKERLAQWDERNQCPENDKLCQEGVWFFQTMFLGPRSDMDQIAEAIRKIHAHAGELAKA
jgi:dTDP-4-amino-4,6-dideoxygalactose transaminase